MNGEYIRQLSRDELLERAMPFLAEAGVGAGADRDFLANVVALEQEKYKLLADIPRLVDFFFTAEVAFDEKAVQKVLRKDGTGKVLEGVRARYSALADFTEAALEKEARAFAADSNLKSGQVFDLLRVAVSGRTEGPTLFRMLEYLGREKVLRRLERALPLCV